MPYPRIQRTPVTTTSFTVVCLPTTGSIIITTSSGDLADPDGFQVMLDGTPRQHLSPGTHTVGLEDLDAGAGERQHLDHDADDRTGPRHRWLHILDRR